MQAVIPHSLWDAPLLDPLKTDKLIPINFLWSSLFTCTYCLGSSLTLLSYDIDDTFLRWRDSLAKNKSRLEKSHKVRLYKNSKSDLVLSSNLFLAIKSESASLVGHLSCVMTVNIGPVFQVWFAARHSCHGQSGVFYAPSPQQRHHKKRYLASSDLRSGHMIRWFNGRSG